MAIEKRIHKTLVFTVLLCLALILPATAAEKDKKEKKPAEPKAGEPKVVSGMSIVGNNEAPKSLYIVPWKSSEIGVDTNLDSGLLNDATAPVDKEVFLRELQFYEITNAN